MAAGGAWAVFLRSCRNLKNSTPSRSRRFITSRIAQHAAQQRKHLSRAEIKLPVELLHRIKNHGGAESRIIHRRSLHAMRVHQFAGLNLQPALLLRLPVKFGARIGRRERNLDRFGIDVACKSDGLLDRLRRLARQSENERAMNLDAQLPGSCARTPGRYPSRTPFLMLIRICSLPDSYPTSSSRSPLSLMISSVFRGRSLWRCMTTVCPAFPGGARSPPRAANRR